MELTVLDINGLETSKKVVLEDDVFNIEPNDHAIYLDVKHYLANLRQGTHKSKERSEVSGSTRKIKRQKGTGGARAGSIRNPLFRGGGRVFGPVPRDYNFKLNKKVKLLARKSALTYKALENSIIVVEDFDFSAPKTKEYITFLNNIKAAEGKSLLVMNRVPDNVYLSARNVVGAKVINIEGLNTYRILDNKKLILSESVVSVINNLLKGESKDE